MAGVQGLPPPHLRRRWPYKSNKDRDPHGGHLPTLPPELVFQLFKTCKARDLCQCSRVCHAWKNIAEDEFLWKNRYYKDFLKIPRKHEGEDKADILALDEEERPDKDERRNEKQLEKAIMEQNLRERFPSKTSFKEMYRDTYTSSKDQRRYAKQQWAIHPPSQFFLESLRDPVVPTEGAEWLEFLPKSMNPLHFVPYHYKTFQPHRRNSGHLEYWNPMNYLRMANCFFFHPHWFWFYFTPIYRAMEVRAMILIVELLLLTYSLSPFLVVYLSNYLGFHPERELLPTFGYLFSMTERASWPMLLRIALCSAVEAPLGTLFVLMYDSSMPYERCPMPEIIFIIGLYFVITVGATLIYYFLTMSILMLVIKMIVLIVFTVIVFWVWDWTDRQISGMNANRLLWSMRTVFGSFFGIVAMYVLGIIDVALPVPLFCISMMLTGVTADTMRTCIASKQGWAVAKPIEVKIHAQLCMASLYLLANLVLSHTIIFYYSFIQTSG